MVFLFTILCSYWTVSGATDNTHLLEVHNSVVSELTASKMRSGEQVEILNLLLLHIDMQDSFNFYVHVCQSPRNHPICRIAHDCIHNDRVLVLILHPFIRSVGSVIEEMHPNHHSKRNSRTRPTKQKNTHHFLFKMKAEASLTQTVGWTAFPYVQVPSFPWSLFDTVSTGGLPEVL